MRYLLALLLLLILASPAYATMYIVDGSGAAPVVGVDYYGNTAKNSTHQTIILGLAAAVGGVEPDTVFVRDGTYAEQITNVRWKANDVFLAGQSKSTIIEWGSASDYTLYVPVSVSDCKISNFTIQSGGVNGSRLVRADAGVTGFTFDDLVIQDFETIQYDPGTAGLRDGIAWVDCTFQNLGNDPVLDSYIFVGPRFGNLSYTRCTFDFDDTAKDTSAPDILIEASNAVSFVGCTFYTNPTTNYTVQVRGDVSKNTTPNQTSSDITFTGNTFMELPAGATKGVFFGGSGIDACVDSITFNYNTVVGNASPSGAQYLVEIENPYDATEVFSEHFDISYNFLTGGTVGIVIAEGGLRGSVTGNRIVSPTEHGILVQDSRHVTVANNWVSGSNVGYETDSGGGRAENSYNLHIVGNVFEDCLTGIYKDRAVGDTAETQQDTLSVYSGNIFRGCTAVGRIGVSPGTAQTLAQWQTYQPVGGPLAGVGSVEYPGGSYDGAVKRAGSLPHGFIRYLGGNGLR